jgi:uncharacterized protein (TIGR03435 family)
VCRPAAAQDEPVKPEAPKRMPADADPSYEVATVKPSNPDNHSDGFHQSGRRLYIENQTMNNILIVAYGIHPKQIIDAPAWLATDHYDIDGVFDTEGQPSLKQMQSVMKKLLADRFQLKFHRETRGLAVYALTVAKGGPKLTKSQGDPNALGNENDQMHGGQITMSITNMSMSELTLIMQFFADRPMVDQTGLAGKWDFKWTWTTDEGRVPPDITNPAPGMFTAIQEQLGLKLEAVRAPAEVLVVDQVERPSAN